jgi:hypothetical protein
MDAVYAWISSPWIALDWIRMKKPLSNMMSTGIAGVVHWIALRMQ